MSVAAERSRSKRIVVVGAGQAGLAMGHALTGIGLVPQQDFILIDSGSPGSSTWTQRWHSLQLCTPALHSSLPGLPFPGDPSRQPSAYEVADYLDRYTHRSGLIPEWDTKVHGVWIDPHEHGLTLLTNRGDIAARNVIAATGPFAGPRAPPFAGHVRVPGANLHSYSYTHPKQVPEGTVLIVGAGKTGRQLARELVPSHHVTLAVGTHQHELPQRVMGIDVSTWMEATGILRIPVHSVIGRRLAGHTAVIGISMKELRVLGVRIVPRIVGATGESLQLADGGIETPNSVLWATGYRPGFE